MAYQGNKKETLERFAGWWKRKYIGRPLMRVIAYRDGYDTELDEKLKPDKPEDLYLNAESITERHKHYMDNHIYMADSLPSIDVNLGPGSLALYLGSKPILKTDTIWYEECIEDYDEWPGFTFNPENYWWNKHKELLSICKKYSNNEYFINMPDLIENMDILSAMRGTENLCYDMIDNPDTVINCIEQIQNVYFKYFDAIYEIIKDKDNNMSYTSFSIYGPGRVAKVQCDFSAVMSPMQFREFVVPSLRKQCKDLNFSLYHLDGIDAIKHVDALMEIEELDGLQWTSGVTEPDGASQKWYPIFDKVKSAGKALWVMIDDGTPDDWADSAERMIKRYGTEGLYLVFPEMPLKDAEKMMIRAERHW